MSDPLNAAFFYEVRLPDKPARVIRLSKIICSAAFGDWDATGYEIKQACVQAAEHALLSLDSNGWDLTMLDARGGE